MNFYIWKLHIKKQKTRFPFRLINTPDKSHRSEVIPFGHSNYRVQPVSRLPDLLTDHQVHCIYHSSLRELKKNLCSICGYLSLLNIFHLFSIVVSFTT